MNKTNIAISGILLILVGLTITSSCNRRSAEAPRQRMSSSSGMSSREDSAVLINSIARSLNTLPEEAVLDLTPPVLILDGKRSQDGQEVTATLSKNPEVPDGPYNYLEVASGNANFVQHKVQPGDLVRYYVDYDQEDLEHGFENVTYIEMIVRRLVPGNPQALILQQGLNAPISFPAKMEIWRYSDRRMREIDRRLTKYVRDGEPAFGWEPSPDESALELLLERVNQWFSNLPENERDENWQVDPLLADLPAEMREADSLAPLISEPELTDRTLQSGEARYLQQAIWLRDISMWAKGDGFSSLDVAEALFDWTVRNIQLDAQPSSFIHHPWQVLINGHGTAKQRAWIFAELCRHQQLDVVMLGVLEEDTGQSDNVPRWWLPALLSEGQLYLFDTRLGVPIPGPEPGSIATLEQVIADPELFQQLATEQGQSYRIGEDQLNRVVAMPVASPLQLTRLAVELQQALEREEFVLLAADNGRLVERLQQVESVQEVQLWNWPFQAVINEHNMKANPGRYEAAKRFLLFAQRPRLWKARVLHFQGNKDIPARERDDPLAMPKMGHTEAMQLYQSPRVRPTERVLATLDQEKQALYRTVKLLASFWLGLASYDMDNPQVSADWLQRLPQDFVAEPWASGARYNLARAYEALGNYEKAIELLQQDDTPQRPGNLYRAEQIKAQQQVEAPSDE